MLLPPLQARSVIGDGIASALYVGNYRFAMHGTDYLAADAPPSPLQHYWSLGVEEQFYLLWPALIIGTAWLVARAAQRTGVAATRSVAPYVVVLALLAAVSFMISLAVDGHAAVVGVLLAAHPRVGVGRRRAGGAHGRSRGGTCPARRPRSWAGAGWR